jgi:putative Holliday junction resolvase
VKILAVDHGEKRTGLAICDPTERMAVALPTHAMTGNDAVDLAELAREQGVERIVVGLPINMDGTEGPRARAVRSFVEELQANTDIAVEVWDERLTTAEGDARLRMHGLDRKERAKRKDAAAAIVILETYLERRK